MKKIIIVIAIIVISLFIGIPVNAASTDHSLIYDIEKFQINTASDEIIFKGWAFINNYHNKGGDNTTISISANNIVTGTTTYDNTRDTSLYEANCIRYSKEKGGNCIETHSNATCNIGTSNSSCRFDNVGFTIKFSINELIDRIGLEETITFTIKVTTNGVTKSESVAVSHKAATGINNVNTIAGNNADITVSGISKKATIRVDQGRVLYNTASDFSWGEKYLWKLNASYDIIDVQNSTRANFGYLKMYKLKYKVGSSTACAQNAQNGREGGCKVGKAEPASNGSYAGWAYASWIKVDGYIRIVLSGQNRTTCPSEEENVPNRLECTNGSYKQVLNKPISFSKVITESNPIYANYPTESDEQGCTRVCTKQKRMIIEGTACITQEGNTNFNISSGEVYSGGGFHFQAYYDSSIKYEFCSLNSRYDLQAKVIGKYCKKESSGDICADSTLIVDGMNDTNVMNYATEHMQNLLENSGFSNITTKSYKSNEVSNEYVNVDAWTEEYVKDSDGDASHWKPGELLTYKLNFNLYNACINRQTSKVRYTNSTDCHANEIKGGALYYIPLKQPSGSFPIKVEATDVNVLRNETWDLEYVCHVNNKQKLYNETTDWSYKFIYRPINLANPFPNRSPGSNWVPFMNDSSAVSSKMNRNNDKIEYEIDLSQTDIVSIKNYNRNKKYTSLDTISNSGNSTYLDTLTFKTHTNNYNELGKCENECWPSE